jgi:hypothetical protein
MRLAVLSMVVLAACGHDADQRVARISAEPQKTNDAPPPSASGDTARRLVPPLPPDVKEADVPVVKLTADNKCLLNGAFVADTTDVAAATTLTKIEGLKKALSSYRDDYKIAHLGDRFPGVVIMDIDETVPAKIVKSAFQSAAFAGFPNVSFVVKSARAM